MIHKYGEFTTKQINAEVDRLRKSIFFLLLCVDKETRDSYQHISVPLVFRNLLYRIGGLNDVLFQPVELVTVISLLQAAFNEYTSSHFNFKLYRKLILDAGTEILKIKECDTP